MVVSALSRARTEVVHRAELMHRLRVAERRRLPMIVCGAARVLIDAITVEEAEGPAARAFGRAAVGQLAHKVRALRDLVRLAVAVV